VIERFAIAVFAPHHADLQLAAARSQAAQASSAHRSCQTDFLRLERMFNEVRFHGPAHRQFTSEAPCDLTFIT
jgi:hypothetical protein